MIKKDEKINLTDSLQKLSVIAKWFDEQENVDVEIGLIKVREAAQIIKDSKGRLAEIENEFKEIEKDINNDEVNNVEISKNSNELVEDEEISSEDIPF